jgi:hypothetical protein
MQRPNKDENNFISILYAVGLKPLANWEITLKNGHVRRDKDADIDTCAIEIIGANVNNNYISTPADPQASLNIKMPTLVMQIKHLRKYFAFEVHILDSKKIKRQFRICNFQVSAIIYTQYILTVFNQLILIDYY